MGMMRPLLVPAALRRPPTLDVDLTAEQLDPRITFSRTGTRSYFDSAGIMRFAAANTWPAEYDPSTVTRVNYMPWSRRFQGAGVTLTNCTVNNAYSINLDGRPDGALVEATVNATPGVTCGFSVNPPLALRMNTTYVMSLYVRAGTVPFLRWGVGNFGGVGDGAVTFDLSTMTVVAGHSDPLANGQATHIRDGIYRLTRTFSTLTDTSGLAAVNLMQTAGSPGWASGIPAGQNIELFGWQMEEGATPTDLIETFATPAGDAVAIGRACYFAGTNLGIRSQEFDTWSLANTTVTANAEIAPDLTQTMDLLTHTNGAARVTRSTGSLASGSQYTYSIFVKQGNAPYVVIALSAATALGNAGAAWFNFATGEFENAGSYGTGWTFMRTHKQRLPGGIWRLGISVTIGATSAFMYVAAAQDNVSSGRAGDTVYVWGSQIESNTIPTPYIATAAASASRASETATVADLASIQFSTEEGTFEIEFDIRNVGSSNSTSVISLGDGTSGGFLILVVNDLRGFLQTCGGNPAGVYSDFQRGRVILTARQNGANLDCRAWTNFPAGPTSATQVGRSLASFSYFGIGGRSRGGGSNDNQPATHMQRVRYWPHIADDAEIAAEVSSPLITYPATPQVDTLTPLLGASPVEQVAPTIDLDLTKDDLDDRVVFVRAGTRTYWAADGTRKIAQANVWPVEYDPLTLTPIGRRCWGSVSNILRQSNTLNTTPWVNASVVVTPGTDVGADGTLSLATVEVTAGGGRLTQPNTITSGSNLCFHLIAKRKNCDFLRLDVAADNSGSGNRFTAWFNLATGAVATTGSVSWKFIRAEIHPLPNGLFHCILVGTTAGVTTAHIIARPSQTDGGSVVAGDQVGLGDAQVENTTFASSYIPTGASNATRAGDEAKLANIVGTVDHSPTNCIFVLDCHANNRGLPGNYVQSVLSLGDGNPSGFLQVVNLESRGFISTPSGSLGAVGAYDDNEQIRVAVRLVQQGANIASKTWCNLPLNQAFTVTARSLASFTFIGIGGRSRGSGTHDAQGGAALQRLRYYPALLTESELDAISR